MELNGKTAIVTGASRGIGEAIAFELAQHGVGVLLVARSTDKIEQIAHAIRDAGGRAEAFTGDVSDYGDVERAVAHCCTLFGRLDILVNNAGLIEPIARIADSDPVSWGKIADINYKGVYHGLRAALPVMLPNQSGTIVNISSGAATGALEGWSHYCSSKAAVLSLTACADREYAQHGIRVVGLSPGTVATDMQVAIKSSGINPVSQLDPAVHISANDAARAVAWLCTKAAADYAGGDFSLKSVEARTLVGLSV